MLKKLLLFFFAISLFTASHSQFVTVLDSSFATNNGVTNPITIDYDYSYSQTIYRKSDIQGSGTITAIKYYFAGNSLANSDSVIVYMGNTSWDYFESLNNKPIILRSRMDSVFKGKASYTTLPGTVTIILNKPFVYNSDSNLVVAVCDIDPGYDLPPAPNISFVGYNYEPFGSGNNKYVTASFVDLNPMTPAYVEMHTDQYIGGGGGVPKITFVGLSPFSCQSPKQVRVSNITHNQAKISWSPPLTTTPAFYDIYYSTNSTKPIKSTFPKAQVNASDTQAVITNLSPDTMNYVWVRSRCGGADTSVWTYSNSFHTLCAPATVPTAIEQFVIPTSTLEWLPSCWALASGDLTSNSQLIYDEDLLAPFQPWINSEWRNVTGSGNYAAKTYFVGQIVDSVSEWLISPPYDLGTSGNKSLEFDLALTKNGNSQQGALDNDDKFAVIISTDEGNTWSSTNVVQQWTSPQSISAAGQHVSIPLNTYSGIVRIAFYAQSKVFVSPVSNLFVDNVQITGVMPVVLLDFTGKLLPPSPGGEGRGEAFLQWRTATEQNNKGFELQRSISGTDFSTIAFVPTKAREGNSTIVLSYNYTDNKPFAGNNYYRLKQIDKDGKATLSNVVLIKGNAAEQLVLSALYPNPTKQTLNIVLTSPTLQNAQLLITDIAGKLIHKQSVQLQQGDNNKTVNVAALQKDNYILKVVCDNGCEAAVSKFVKE